VLQSTTGNFSELRHAVYPTSAAACWPVKPASQVKQAAEQETGSKAQPATARQSSIPVSPTDLAMLTSCGEMCLFSQGSFWGKKDLLGHRGKKWDGESFGG